MQSIIFGVEPAGKCDLTGKDNTEVFVVQVGNGPPKRVVTSRLLEILRFTASIDDADNDQSIAPRASARSPRSGDTTDKIPAK